MRGGVLAIEPKTAGAAGRPGSSARLCFDTAAFAAGDLRSASLLGRWRRALDGAMESERLPQPRLLSRRSSHGPAQRAPLAALVGMADPLTPPPPNLHLSFAPSARLTCRKNRRSGPAAELVMSTTCLAWARPASPPPVAILSPVGSLASKKSVGSALKGDARHARIRCVFPMSSAGPQDLPLLHTKPRC